MKSKFPPLTAAKLAQYKSEPDGPALFIEEQCACLDPATEQWIPPTLFPLQRQVITEILTTRRDDGTRRYRKCGVFWPRKLGKTNTIAFLVKYLVTIEKNHLVLLASPKKEQTRDLAFGMITASFERNPGLIKSTGAELLKDKIFIRATNSTILNIACGAGGAAGYGWTVLFLDELSFWYGRELEEWYETLYTPSPTRKDPMILAASYGPIKDKSKLLNQWLKLGRNPPESYYQSLVRGRSQVLNAAPWYNEKFLSEIEQQVSKTTFKRVYLNLPVTLGDAGDHFAFSNKQVEEATDPTWNMQTERPKDALGLPICGIDFAPKFDASAMMLVGKHKDGSLKLWNSWAQHGSKDRPLNQNVVVNTLMDWIGMYGRIIVVCDPLGLTDAIEDLRSKHIVVVEVSRKAHVLGNLIWRAVAGKRVILYPDAAKAKFTDGRWITLQDEMRHLQLDEHYKMKHEGEGSAVGRWFDDRCTALSLVFTRLDPSLAKSRSIEGNILKERIDLNAGTSTAHPRVFGKSPNIVVPRLGIAGGTSGGFSGFRRF